MGMAGVLDLETIATGLTAPSGPSHSRVTRLPLNPVTTPGPWAVPKEFWPIRIIAVGVRDPSRRAFWKDVDDGTN